MGCEKGGSEDATRQEERHQESGCEEDGPGLFTGSGDGSIAFWRRDERRMLPVYFLYVDLGKDLDVEHLQFLSGRVTPTPLGPFQFLHITTATGTSGNHYDVVLNPQ